MAESRPFDGDRLLEAYRRYYAAQLAGSRSEAPVSQVRRLMAALACGVPETLAGWQALNDRLFAVWEAYVGRLDVAQGRDFTTNGSSGNVARRYRFGPHGDLWIRALWSVTRFPLGFREVIRLTPSLDGPAPLTLSADPSGMYPQMINCGILNRHVLQDLLMVLREFLGRFPSCSLISVPDTFLFLNAQEPFRDFAVAHRDRLNLISQNWEPFYKQRELRERGVQINDTMVDWTTGLNFYTCRAGQRHLVPIFASRAGTRVNLLNLMPPDETQRANEQDRFVPQGIVRCPCGRHRLEFEFLPHPATAIRTMEGEIVYDLALAERLEATYGNLQFVQEGETIAITYQSDRLGTDRDLLEDYFAQRGFQVAWRPDAVCRVGLKRPVFYRYQRP